MRLVFILFSISFNWDIEMLEDNNLLVKVLNVLSKIAPISQGWLV